MAIEIWMASSELSPLARTGGLGDVIRALPLALVRAGAKVRRFIPAYGSVDQSGFEWDPEQYDIPVGDLKLPVRFMSWTDEVGVTTTLVVNTELFGREEIYGPKGAEYPDNPRRFAFFCRAISELAARSKRRPDVLHAHDWPAALIPLYLKYAYEWPLGRPATVFSIHNLAYQGRYSAWNLDWLSLPPATLEKIFKPAGMEYYGDINFLKAGLIYSDRLTTVSPTYATDILASEYGCGLEGVLKERVNVLSGILNGADEDVWDSAKDPHLSKRFTSRTVTAGKKAAKKIVQKEFGLAASDRPMLAMLGRLAHQKGVDVLLQAALPLIGNGIDICIVGDGDPQTARACQRMRKHLPNRVGVYIGYDDYLAHLLMAGADLVAVPSRYEPCGLTQMYAQKYGTVPVVHRTGGLTDTVIDLDERPEEGTGFIFSPLTPDALGSSVLKASTILKGDPKRWKEIQQRGMKQDFSWEKAAWHYLSLYKDVAKVAPGIEAHREGHLLTA